MVALPFVSSAHLHQLDVYPNLRIRFTLQQAKSVQRGNERQRTNWKCFKARAIGYLTFCGRRSQKVAANAVAVSRAATIRARSSVRGTPCVVERSIDNGDIVVTIIIY